MRARRSGRRHVRGGGTRATAEDDGEEGGGEGGEGEEDDDEDDDDEKLDESLPVIDRLPPPENAKRPVAKRRAMRAAVDESEDDPMFQPL